jgi:hypothetical protein
MNEVLKDSKGKASSKRLFGTIGLTLFFLASIGIAVYSVFTGNDVGPQAAGLVNGVGYVSGALLGVGVFEGIGKSGE